MVMSVIVSAHPATSVVIIAVSRKGWIENIMANWVRTIKLFIRFLPQKKSI